MNANIQIMKIKFHLLFLFLHKFNLKSVKSAQVIYFLFLFILFIIVSIKFSGFLFFL